VKILRSYYVTLPELSMESSVNEDNTSAKHFSVKILEVFTLCNRTYNKCFDFNTTEFKCDNTHFHFTLSDCPETATITNVLIPV